MDGIYDLVRTAKRENNAKRPYLYVNPLQGKHMPVAPGRSLALFAELAERVERAFSGESLLVIGFAETATAIGLAVACGASNVKYCVCTTREDVPGAEYQFFTESHSHAAEQRLAVNGLLEALSRVDRVLFVEDEVTTGNTIEKLMNALRERYPAVRLRFGIASILNSMLKERMEELEGQGVPCIYLGKIPERFGEEKLSMYAYEPLAAEPEVSCGVPVRILRMGNYRNFRLVCPADAARETCLGFTGEAVRRVSVPAGAGRILVLGTEEYMYPAMVFADALKKAHPEVSVLFHATTRSPIEVSRDPEYPLHRRAPLISLYDSGRRTFVYNLAAYDRAVIVTDAADVSAAADGIRSLAAALNACGNKEIELICQGERFGGSYEEQLFR